MSEISTQTQAQGLTQDATSHKDDTPAIDAWPTEMRLKDRGRLLSVTFDDGVVFDLSAEYLRVMSPSAEVQGHSPDERKTVAGKINVAISDISYVGNYAVRLEFDDAHSTGLYTWPYLYRLGRDHSEKWAAHLAELAEKGLSRDFAVEEKKGCGSGSCGCG